MGRKKNLYNLNTMILNKYSRRSVRRSKIVSCILGVYGIFASVAVLALIM